MTTHDDIKADLSLFVLGALEDAEARVVAEHLEGCDECRAESARWHEVVDLLPFASESGTPPDLRNELMQRLGKVPAASLSPAVVPPVTSAKVVRLPRRRWPAVALAAAASLALAYGISREVRLRSEVEEQQRLVSDLRGALARAADDRTAGQSALERVRNVLAERERDSAALRTALTAAEQSLTLLQRPGLNLVRLKQTADAKPAEGHVLISASTGKALFYAFDLAPLPPGKVYELWWITEKEGPINAGLFEPDPSGIGRVEAAVPSGAGALKAAAVTIEPSGGVTKPTGPMVLAGNI